MDFLPRVAKTFGQHKFYFGMHVLELVAYRKPAFLYIRRNNIQLAQNIFQLIVGQNAYARLPITS